MIEWATGTSSWKEWLEKLSKRVPGPPLRPVAAAHRLGSEARSTDRSGR